MANATPPITRELIENASDGELYEALDATIKEYLSQCNSAEYDAAFLRLPRGLQLFWHFEGIEFEVLNGGFWQFFNNSSGAYALDTLEALQVFNLKRRADILDRALDLYEQKTGRPRDCRERWKCEDLIDPDVDKLCSEYCAAQDSELANSVIDYVREKPNEFIYPTVSEDSAI